MRAKLAKEQQLASSTSAKATNDTATKSTRGRPARSPVIKNKKMLMMIDGKKKKNVRFIKLGPTIKNLMYNKKKAPREQQKISYFRFLFLGFVGWPVGAHNTHALVCVWEKIK